MGVSEDLEEIDLSLVYFAGVVAVEFCGRGWTDSYLQVA